MILTHIQNYIKEIQQKFDTNQATEHSYRSALQTLLESISPNIIALNESQRITGVGMPDFTIKDKKNNEINIGQIEAKDLHIDLDEKKNKDQLGRYLNAFDNFIYTNEGASQKLETLLKDFLDYQGTTITSSAKLAKVMAGKAQLLNVAIKSILAQQSEDVFLRDQLRAFQEILIHDMTEDQFADMYAQTIVYGLFAARLYDPTLTTFSRVEAEGLIPKSTPFLRRLFKQIANDDEFDDRIAHIIDDLIAIFLHCNVRDILVDYGKQTQRKDAIVHFYEDFLGEYNPSLRKSRGVYYTPEPVVEFIVKGVDHLLKKEFGISNGLADTGKIEHTRVEQKGTKIKEQVHKVQILDPATGTGTFLDHVIKHIHRNNFEGQQGIRQGYVEKDLLPRLFGFEVLMASYTMCHLKLALTLEETGYKDEGKKRLGVYLTNSLEEANPHARGLFASHLAREAEEASSVKKDKPVMVVLGNPPYAVSSSNKGVWIQKLLEDYKKDLNEKKINLDDDYIKFIRYAQHYIDKNGEGIIAMITNNSYIDGITHRKMRKTLLESFDKIYVYDLHGNSKKKEVCPDGSKDENVFDIMQGVSIIFAVKSSKSQKQAEVYHYDSRGKRDLKYEKLGIQNIYPSKSDYPSKSPLQGETSSELTKAPLKGVGGGNVAAYKQTGYGNVTEEEQVGGKNTTEEEQVGGKNDKWKISLTQDDVRKRGLMRDGKRFPYNPENVEKAKNLRQNPTLAEKKLRNEYLRNCSVKFYRQRPIDHFIADFYCAKKSLIIEIDGGIHNSKEAQGYDIMRTEFLNLYGLQVIRFTNNEIFNDFENVCKKIDAIPIREDIETDSTKAPLKGVGGKFTPEELFDYIYAVLHSPKYREKYKEFLKIDFPRIPFTNKKEIFWKLVEKGEELRLYHLMEHQDSNKLLTQYQITGDNFINKIKFNIGEIEDKKIGKVYINSSQYFDNVPEIARNFHIGGYQPAQKWLKDRKGRQLSFEDIFHRQKIIVALTNTDRIMKEIEFINFL